MNQYPCDVSIIGGDLRFQYLAEHLLEKGERVMTYGCAGTLHHPNHQEAQTLEEAIRQSAVIVGSIPLCKENYLILHSNKSEQIEVGVLAEMLADDQTFFAGCIPETLKEMLYQKRVLYYDFMEDDAITIFNSVATAEGVIAEAVKAYPGNLHSASVLVLGYGTCARTLAEKLKYLTAAVSICARNIKQLAMAQASGFETMTYERLQQEITGYHLVFNTVPMVVLNQEVLKNVNHDTVILDIASSPGGVDYQAAMKLGVKAEIYPGLPGKYAPKASGEALALYVLQTMK